MNRQTYHKCQSCKRKTVNPITGRCESEYCRSSPRYMYRQPATSSQPPAEPGNKAKPTSSTPSSRKGPETFPRRALRLFAESLRRGFTGAFGRIRRSREYIRRSNERISKWEENHTLLAALATLALAFGGAILLSLWWRDYLGRGQFGKLLQLIILALPILSLFVTRAISATYQVVAPAVYSLLLILWLPCFALIQVFIVLAKFGLLIPLALISVCAQLIQLWRRIFYTCPSRQCAYRGAPRHACPGCGESNRHLWPNLHGLLWHHCVNCDARLPTLDRLGRDRLERRCGGCEMPLRGRHAGRAPEHLIAIAGAQGSGKTNYLLMAVNEITNGHQRGAPLRGEIDDHAQAETFQREWRKLTQGIPAAKTSEVIKALLLYAKVGSSRRQLYLYDAPGEEFASISAMSKQQYFHLLEGIVLLVDPLSFESVRVEAGAAGSGIAPLQDVVTAILGWAASGAAVNQKGKIKLRVAAVISKADLACVKKYLDADGAGRATSEACRAALIKWGGGNAVNALEHRFEAVEYFACSPLGRAAEAYNRQPFQGRGVLEPLAWVLKVGFEI